MPTMISEPYEASEQKRRSCCFLRSSGCPGLLIADHSMHTNGAQVHIYDHHAGIGVIEMIRGHHG